MSCSEQEYQAGVGKNLDIENDASVVNRSSSFVKYDGISKQVIVSPKPLNNNFSFTKYLSPKAGEGGKSRKGLSPHKGNGDKVKKLAAKYSSAPDGKTETETETKTDEEAHSANSEVGAGSVVAEDEAEGSQCAAVAEMNIELSPFSSEEMTVEEDIEEKQHLTNENIKHDALTSDSDTLPSDDATLLLGVKGCGGSLDTAQEAVKAVEASIGDIDTKGISPVVKDVTETKCTTATDVRSVEPPTPLAFIALVLIFTGINTILFSFSASQPASMRINRAPVHSTGPVISVKPKVTWGGLWAAPSAHPSPRIWSSPVDAALQLADVEQSGADGFLQHLPVKGFRISSPTEPSTGGTSMVRLSAKLISRGGTNGYNAPIDPLVYQAMQVLKGPKCFIRMVNAFFSDQEVQLALTGGV